jgi:hypothetical protein
MGRRPLRVIAYVGVAMALVAGLAACGNNGSPTGASGGGTKPANTKVGVLLPDTASSPRWVSADPRQIGEQCKLQPHPLCGQREWQRHDPAGSGSGAHQRWCRRPAGGQPRPGIW